MSQWQPRLSKGEVGILERGGIDRMGLRADLAGTLELGALQGVWHPAGCQESRASEDLGPGLHCEGF